jgi:hypothetical protein
MVCIKRPLTYLQILVIWIVIFFDEAFKYGNGAKFLYIMLGQTLNHSV